MKTRNTLIGLGVAAALAAGVGAYAFTASAQDGSGYGPGMMGGYGFGMMDGYGRGDSQGGGNGSGPGYGHMHGDGAGIHMRGWGGGSGPGMMRGYGYGPGMMQGYGPGYARRGDAQGNQTLNLTIDDVKGRVERWLTWQGNPRLKVGEVKEKDADTITADVVTKDNALVQRFIVDRHTGFVRQDNNS